MIVHLALPRKPHTGPDKRRAIFETSVVATFHLLESARRYGIGRVLVASTGDALGATGCAQEDDECHRPASFYGTAKACEELVARCRDDTVASGILRFFHPYGPGGEAYLVNRLLRQVIAGERIEIEEPNGIDLNPVWIDDLATGICLAVDSRHGGIFHFAGPETVTLRALVELSGEISRREPRVQLRKGHVRGGHAGDFRRARPCLGLSSSGRGARRGQCAVGGDGLMVCGCGCRCVPRHSQRPGFASDDLQEIVPWSAFSLLVGSKTCSTKDSGRRLTSSNTRQTYSPIIPVTNRLTPDKSATSATILGKPGTGEPTANEVTTMKIAYTKLTSDTEKPTNVTSLIGAMENPSIDSIIYVAFLPKLHLDLPNRRRLRS